MSDDKHNIRLFLTPEHECSYLSNQVAATAFVDPEVTVSQSLLSELSRNGFRRSGEHIYRPHCKDCAACISTRVVLKGYTPTRSQKRVLNKAKQLTTQQVGDIDNDDIYALYEKYINTRHKDGDMFPATREQYSNFLSSQCYNTEFWGFYDNLKLIGVAVCDVLDDGLSAVYTFFDPDYSHLSLGKYAILWQTQEAKRRNLPYLYLGYWIKGADKMEYKLQYRPIELYINGRWLALS